MVRKVIAMLAILSLCFAFGVTAQAASYTPYEGTISSTYITYFKDIVSGIGFNENYVAFRSGQYDYVLVVGDLEYSGTTFTLNDTGTIYTFTTSGNYNSYTSYDVQEISDFSMSPSDKIIYSDLGQFPQLLERGAKYEMLSAVLLCIALLGFVVGRFFVVR